jgi:hypothetical protein
LSYRILLLIDSIVAKLLRTVRKHWLAILLFVAISPLLLCIGSIGYMFLYGTVDRITDFRPFSGDVQFQGTKYVMKVTKGLGKFGDVIFEINLKNTVNRNELSITRGAGGGNPEYSAFQANGKTYFILKTGSLGNDGSMHFQIYDLSGDQIRPIDKTSTGEPAVYSSCVYPQLNQNELFFEDAFDCDIYPVLVDEQFFSSVKLSP